MTRLFVALMALSTLIAPIMARESPSVRPVPFDHNNAKCVTRALFWLDKVIEQAKSIKEESERNCLLEHLSELQTELNNAYLSKDLRTVNNSCVHLSENACEILSECSDVGLRTQILSCLCSMAKEVEHL